jgi:hypothetical protein
MKTSYRSRNIPVSCIPRCTKSSSLVTLQVVQVVPVTVGFPDADDLALQGQITIQLVVFLGIRIRTGPGRDAMRLDRRRDQGRVTQWQADSPAESESESADSGCHLGSDSVRFTQLPVTAGTVTVARLAVGPSDPRPRAGIRAGPVKPSCHGFRPPAQPRRRLTRPGSPGTATHSAAGWQPNLNSARDSGPRAGGTGPGPRPPDSEQRAGDPCHCHRAVTVTAA